jgi:hypothetical protein
MLPRPSEHAYLHGHTGQGVRFVSCVALQQGRQKLIAWVFIQTAVLLLAVTALAKILAATGEARILGQPDPLLGLLSMRQSMLLAAALEIVVVVLVYRAPNVLRKAELLLWIAGVFLVYRIGLWWIGFEGSCRCLGNVGDVFGISAEIADWIAKGVLAYLLVGSGAILL